MKIVAAWGALLACALGQDTKSEVETAAEVVRLFGTLDRQTKNEWSPVPVPAPGDKPVEWPSNQVWRANPSRPAQVRFSNGVRLDLQAASEIVLIRTKSRYRFQLLKGECLFDIGFTSGKAPDEAIEVVLPNGAVIVPAATKAFVRVVCRIDKEKDHVAVLNGQVKIKTRENEVSVKQGEGLEVDPKAGGLTPKKEDVLTQAAWSRWEEKQRAKKNLLKDGDMESSKTSEWKVEYATLTKDLREVFEGRQSLKIVATTGADHHPRVFQEIKVVPGSRLRLTGWVKTSKTLGRWGIASSSADLLPMLLRPSEQAIPNEWTYCEQELQVPEGKTVLRVFLACDKNDIAYWDAVVLTPE